MISKINIENKVVDLEACVQPTFGSLSCGSNTLSEACANKIYSSQLKWEYI